MKIKILLFCSCLSFFIVACHKKPAIKVDFSALTATKDSLRTFVVYNTGNDTLVIEDFVTSCNCTTVNLKKNQTVAAGDSLIVNVKLELDRESPIRSKPVIITLKTNTTPRLTSFTFKT